jgi:hypothetical protein
MSMRRHRSSSGWLHTCKISPIALKEVQPVRQAYALQCPLVIKAVVGIQP